MPGDVDARPDQPRKWEAMQAEMTRHAARHPLAYSIGTLVTSPEQYEAMRASFEARGFGGDDCEFIAIDNTGARQTSAYSGLNALLNRAKGRRVVLCHQDVRLLTDDRAALDARLDALSRHDPHWAVAGNAGGEAPGRLAMRITDPHGKDRHIGNLPARVSSLDENFLVLDAAARLSFSRDLDGFHFYGTDICLMAEVLGYSAYVIDFHLEHLSPGRKDASFEAARAAFVDKWSRAMRPRFIQTTCSLVHVGGGAVASTVGRLVSGPGAGVVRRLPAARGWNRRSRP